jgi:hypothetical protein
LNRHWIIIPACALLLLALGGCSQASPPATSAAEAQAHWLAASKALGTIQSVSDRIYGTDPAWAKQTIPGVAAELQSTVTSATKELDATDQAVSQLPEGEMKSAYSRAIEGGRDAVAKSGAAIPMVSALPDLWANGLKADESLSAARTDVNKSVDAANAGKFESSVKYANQALGEVKKAENAARAIKVALAGKKGFAGKGAPDKALEAIANERSLAQASLDVAIAGTAASTAQYNAAIARYRKAVAATDAQPDIIEAVGPAVFRTATTDALRSAADALDAAQAAYRQALQAADKK